MRLSVLLLVVALALPGTARADLDADLEAALEAYRGNDYTTAARLLKPLADRGEPNALNVLAWLYSEGKGVPKDGAKAFRLYKRAADAGHVEATFTAGLYYGFGKAGVTMDKNKAFQMYRIAAEKGYARAQFHVGNGYSNGAGTEKDLKKAVYWYRRAADQGHSDARFSLGRMLFLGNGVVRNREKGVQLLEDSAKAGNEYAMGFLSTLHFKGRIPSASMKMAWMYLDLAARLGDGPSKTVLDMMVEPRMTAEQINAAMRLQEDWLKDASFDIPPPRKR